MVTEVVGDACISEELQPVINRSLRQSTDISSGPKGFHIARKAASVLAAVEHHGVFGRPGALIAVNAKAKPPANNPNDTDSE